MSNKEIFGSLKKEWILSYFYFQKIETRRWHHFLRIGCSGFFFRYSIPCKILTARGNLTLRQTGGFLFRHPRYVTRRNWGVKLEKRVIPMTSLPWSWSSASLYSTVPAEFGTKVIKNESQICHLLGFCHFLPLYWPKAQINLVYKVITIFKINRKVHRDLNERFKTLINSISLIINL